MDQRSIEERGRVSSRRIDRDTELIPSMPMAGKRNSVDSTYGQGSQKYDNSTSMNNSTNFSGRPSQPMAAIDNYESREETPSRNRSEVSGSDERWVQTEVNHQLSPLGYSFLLSSTSQVFRF